jgi:hypothetical protein
LGFLIYNDMSKFEIILYVLGFLFALYCAISWYFYVLGIPLFIAIMTFIATHGATVGTLIHFIQRYRAVTRRKNKE